MTDIIKPEGSLDSNSNRLFDKIKNSSQESQWFNNFVNHHTKRSYLRAIKDFSQFLGLKNKEELRDVTPAHVIAYRDYLLHQGLEKSTVGSRLSGLSSLFDDLIKNQIMKYNPVASVKRPGYQHNKVLSVRLSEPQMLDMLNRPDLSTLIGLRDWVFLSILFGTGCRISEVCNLLIKDNYQDAEYHVLKFKVKGGKVHPVAISPLLQNRINQYLTLSGHDQDPDHPLLLSYSNNKKEIKPISTMTGTRIWDKYKVVEQSTPHSSRTTFISEAIKRGENLVSVQETVNHVDPRTTQKYNKTEFGYRNSVALGVRI